MNLHSDPSFLLVRNGAVTVSAKLLASLAAANSCSQRSSRSLEQKVTEKDLMRMRLKMAAQMVLGDAVEVTASEKRKVELDSSWVNMKSYLTGRMRTHMLVEWDEPILTVIGGFLYAATINLILSASGNDPREEIVAFHHTAPPTGSKALSSWAESGYKGPMPDSLFAAHVFELNLQAIARDDERVRQGVHVQPSILTLLYTTRAQDAAVAIPV
jgi:hypothetical protein